MYHVSLVSIILISMVMFHLNKHIYDIMSILFISLLRIKLNLNLPIFLTSREKSNSRLVVGAASNSQILVGAASNSQAIAVAVGVD